SGSPRRASVSRRSFELGLAQLGGRNLGLTLRRFRFSVGAKAGTQGEKNAVLAPDRPPILFAVNAAFRLLFLLLFLLRAQVVGNGIEFLRDLSGTAQKVVFQAVHGISDIKGTVPFYTFLKNMQYICSKLYVACRFAAPYCVRVGKILQGFVYG